MADQFIVWKAWRSAPNYWQHATRKIYSTRERAEEAKQTLISLFPGRVFRVEKLEDTTFGGSD